MTRLSKSFRAYAANAEGSMTLLGLYIGVTMLIVGAMALDVSNLIAVRTQLQSAADFAAHAALYERVRHDKTPEEAKQIALAMVKKTYPHKNFGDMLKTSDIHFGNFDASNGGFQVDENSTAAAVAFAKRNSDNGNSVFGYLSKLIGYTRWGVQAAAVFETFRPSCLRDGWIGEATVDAQSNNTFKDGFCIHSNQQVEFNSGSTFEPGVEVSSPEGYDTTIVPSSGYTSNSGLHDSIQASYYNLLILDSMQEIFDNLQNPASEYYRPYLVPSLYVDPQILIDDPLYVPPPGPVTIPTHNATTADFQQGYVNEIFCPGNQQLFIDATPTLKNVAIYTDCKVTFRQNSALENVVLYTTNTDDRSITAPNGLRMGANDGCAHDGGVQFMTKGGFQVAQELQIYGSQVLAQGPIQFAAAADGIEGASFISGQTVDGTSNTAMGICPNDGGEVFEVDLFRMAG